jgi:hypothetical protein
MLRLSRATLECGQKGKFLAAEKFALLLKKLKKFTKFSRGGN